MEKKEASETDPPLPKVTSPRPQTRGLLPKPSPTTRRARKLWGAVSPPGQHFVVDGNLVEVVGVAEDGKYHDLTESLQPAAYLPITNDHSDAFLIVRSPRAPSEMAGALRGALGTVLPNVPIFVESWSESLRDELFPATAGHRFARRDGSAGGAAGGDGDLRHGRV